jgi:hypothetical protein
MLPSQLARQQQPQPHTLFHHKAQQLFIFGPSWKVRISSNLSTMRSCMNYRNSHHLPLNFLNRQHCLLTPSQPSSLPQALQKRFPLESSMMSRHRRVGDNSASSVSKRISPLSLQFIMSPMNYGSDRASSPPSV